MDDMDDIVREFLVESAENLDQLDADLVALEANPGARDLLASIFRTVHTIKGTAGFLAFTRLEAISHAGEAVLSELRDGRATLTTTASDALLNLVDTIRAVLAGIEANGAEPAGDDSALLARMATCLSAPPAEETPTPRTPPTPAEAAPAPVVTKPVPPAEQAPPVAAPTPAALAPARPAEETATEPTRAETTVRVDVAVLDDLLRQVGELVLARNQITRLVGASADGNEPLLRATHGLDLIASDLQEAVMRARMQPIDHLWSKMPRMVRDLAAHCDRKVRLDVSGGDTELDRSLLEAIKDPLTHLIRNAVDHGLESPADRAAAGKDPTGTIRLSAYHSGGQVIVEVGDDGAGIDPAKIRAAGVRKGVVTAADADALSDRQALDLLFLPGFSTAEHVTNVSGRGVGMDVVRTKIEQVGGSVDVESTPGTGTLWRLRIPLTLAIMPAVLVTSGGHTFVTPQVNIAELVKITTADIETVQGAPVYRLRGDLLTLVGLSDVLGHDPADNPDRVIVVVQVDTTRFGLVVDKVITATEVVVKPLSHHLKAVPMFGGATILGDGALALILDVQAIARQALGATNATRTRTDATAHTVEHADTEQLLIVHAAGRRLGLPMNGATRLEEVTPDAIERAGQRQVTQYRGRIMPITPLSRVVSGVDHPGAMLVVYDHHGADVAVMVDTIDDIVTDTISARTPATGQGVGAASVVAGHVVEVVDLDALLPAITLTGATR